MTVTSHRPHSAAGTKAVDEGWFIEGTSNHKDLERWSKSMIFEAEKARLRVKRAQLSLDQANQALDDDAGVCLSLAMLSNRIASDQLRIKDGPKVTLFRQ